MWLILFVGSLMTSMASGLYTPICAEGGLPVCATNGVAYLYFENECRLNAYIYKQIYLGQRVPIKTDLENCLLNCHEIVCPAMFKPVCAQQVPDGAVRTVPNACLVNQLICATKRHWKVIGEGPCAPTLKSTPLTDEEYSFTSPPSEDYLASNPEPISTSYIASSSYKGQEYLSPPSSDSSSYAVQDQSQNYIESVPAPVPYTTPVAEPPTYEISQPAPCSASGSDPLPYTAPDQSQNYQAPSDSLPYTAPDQSQSYQAPAPAPVPIAPPYGQEDPNKNYVAPTVSVPASAPCPYATAPDSTPAPYETLDQSQNYVAPAKAPKSYPVMETIPSSAPYEAQPPSQCPAPTPSVEPAPYTSSDQIKNFVLPVPAPAPAPYMASDASQYEAQKSAPAPCSTIDQSPKYIEPAPAPLPYQGQEPVPSPYEAPCSNANSVPATAPAPYSSLDQGQSYVTGLSAPAPYATQNTIPAPYEAEQTALYSNAAGPAPPTQPVYTNSAPAPISSPYDVPQPAASPCTEETPAYAPYIALNPAVVTNEVQQTPSCPYATSASVSDPAAYTVPEQTQSYVAPIPVPVVYTGSDPVSPLYEAQQTSTNTYSSPAVAPAPAPASPAYSSTYPDPAPAAAPCEIQKPAPYTPSAPALTPTPYVSSAPVPAPAPYEQPQPASYPYIASNLVQVPYEAQQPTLCAASVSAPTDLLYTAPDKSQSYPSAPLAPISASYANPETTPAYKAQPPAPCSCAAANQYSESRTPLLSNIYSRLPGSLDLTKLFKQLRRRFGMFVYQPRYTHIIISD